MITLNVNSKLTLKQFKLKSFVSLKTSNLSIFCYSNKILTNFQTYKKKTINKFKSILNYNNLDNNNDNFNNDDNNTYESYEQNQPLFDKIIFDDKIPLHSKALCLELLKNYETEFLIKHRYNSNKFNNQIIENNYSISKNKDLNMYYISKNKYNMLYYVKINIYKLEQDRESYNESLRNEILNLDKDNKAIYPVDTGGEYIHEDQAEWMGKLNN